MILEIKLYQTGYLGYEKNPTRQVSVLYTDLTFFGVRVNLSRDALQLSRRRVSKIYSIEARALPLEAFAANSRCNDPLDYLVEKGVSMGFWKSIVDANPHKSMARGRELASTGIEFCSLLPQFMHDRAKECAVCKVRFGQIFAKDVAPFLLTLEEGEAVSFGSGKHHVVCERCVNTFGLESIAGRK
jgi:hypothetical protein